jgi:hypothetical protein
MKWVRRDGAREDDDVDFALRSRAHRPSLTNLPRSLPSPLSLQNMGSRAISQDVYCTGHSLSPLHTAQPRMIQPGLKFLDYKATHIPFHAVQHHRGLLSMPWIYGCSISSIPLYSTSVRI